MRDIRDRTDIISLALGCTVCLDELLEEFSADKKRSAEKRGVLKLFNDSIDFYQRMHDEQGRLRGHIRVLPAVPPDFVFTKYEEVYVLKKLLRENRGNPDLTLESVSSNLKRILGSETSQEQKREYAKKLIPFFLGIGEKCNTYTENPPEEFSHDYIPPELIRRLALKESPVKCS